MGETTPGARPPARRPNRAPARRVQPPRSGVCAIVVAHESGRWLDRTLASLRAQSTPPDSVIVVRMGAVEIGDADASVVDFPPDGGFAAAANEGARHAGDARHLLFVHDDAELHHDALERLLECSTTSVDAVGAKLVEWDDAQMLQEVGAAIDRFGSRRAVLEPGEIDHGQYDQAVDVVFCSACLLVRRAAFDRVSGFDPGAFPLYEDVDLCWRFRASGGRVLVQPRAKVRHVAAMSRGLRAGSPDAAELAAAVERGRLRLLLKNFRPVALALVIPQYVVASILSIVAALLRRRLWRVRATVTAWGRLVRELPDIIESRSQVAERVVDDDEILGLATRQVAPARRLARVASVGRATDSLRSAERRLLALLRRPDAIAVVFAAATVLLVLRDVLFGGAFTLGELRPIPAFGDALRAWVSGTRPEGFDPVAPGGPGLVVVAALRLVPGVDAALAEKLLLVLPLVVAGTGGRRLAGGLGFSGTAPTWVGAALAVNPATLVLATEGFVGALVAWAGATWLAASLLAPGPRPGGLRGIGRRALLWAAVCAVHPPALLWLSALGIVVSIAVGNVAADRVRRVVAGAAGAFVLTMPWSLDWLGPSTPIAGAQAGFVQAEASRVWAASLGGSWPVLAATLVVFAALLVVRPSRPAAAVGIVVALAWAAGAARLVPHTTAFAAASWGVIVLAADAARGVRDSLRRTVLGWRQIAAVATGAAIAGTWLAGSAGALIDGADANAVPVVSPQSARRGRILWLMPSAGGTLTWATDRYDARARSWPVAKGPAERHAVEALAAARAGRTHRLGSLLAMAGVSDVVLLDARLAPRARAAVHDTRLRSALSSQADLELVDRQGGATIFRNRSWSGLAFAPDAPPVEPVSPAGIAAVASSSRPLTMRGVARARVESPGRGAVVYLAVGSRRGWTVGGRTAHRAGPGVWVRAGADGTLQAAAPGRWRRALLPLSLIAVATAAAMWAGGAWLSGRLPALAPPPPAPAAFGQRALLAGGLVVAGAAALAGAARASPAAGRFLSAATYCPAAGDGPTQRVAIANPWDERVAYLVRPAITAPPTLGAVIDPRSRITIDVDAKAGAVVESFGRPLVASALVATDAADLAGCRDTTTRATLFAEGGRTALDTAAANVRTAFVIRNPFPDQARVSFRFFTGDDSVAPPALQDVVVDAGTTRIVDPEEQLEPVAELGAEVIVWRGRAIVARRLRRAGLLSLSLGTPLVRSGYLPRAVTTLASTTLVAVNPHDSSAEVELSATGPAGSLPTLQFDVGPGGHATFPLSGPAADQEDLLVHVRASPPAGVEAVVIAADRHALAVVAPVAPATTCILPAVEGRALIVGNPGERDLVVRIRRLGPGAPVQAVPVAAGRMVVVAVDGTEPFGLLLRAPRPIVCAAAGRSGTAAGVPLRV